MLRYFRLAVKSAFALILMLCLLTSSAQSGGAQSRRYLHSIAGRTEFDALSRIYYQGRFSALPHLMFVIDRAEKDPRRRIYFINSKIYTFHKEFVSASYLSLERGQEFYRHNYLEKNRRFILGTIVYQTRVEKFTFELWEGDLADGEIIREAWEAISRSFFAPVSFKPNSRHQEEATNAAEAGASAVPRLPASEVNPPVDYLPLNNSRNIGVLRIIDRMSDETIIDRNEIVIFREPPISMTPLSGVITTSFSTPLSHVNLLARGWGIPNAYISGAAELFKPLVGKFVYFETRDDGYVLRPADQSETQDYGRRLARRSDLLTPEADLDFMELTPLDKQRRKDSIRFGAKSANLGEMIHAIRSGRVKGITVPPGLTIPFGHYQKFIEENGLDRIITELSGDDRFNHDPAYRKQRLARLREMIQKGRLNPDFEKEVLSRRHKLLGDKGVFVRSSTNSEDLPDFSGAGLYTSVPNVIGDGALLDAIRTVWASVWNYEAWEARESFGINHSAVYPAVLIQVGMNAEAAGVLITTNPFDKKDRNSVYINAKRGLGMRVVEGRRVPEQLLFKLRTGAVQSLTRSGDDTMLTFDENGGVRSVSIDTERAVLKDSIVQKLSRAALAIRSVFAGINQDIEWLTIGDKIYIVQSRPYIEK